MKNSIYLIVFLICFQTVHSQCNKEEIFANETTSSYCFDTINQVRKCYTNDIPSHEYGPFGGNGAILGQDFDFSMCLYPELGNSTTYLFEDITSQGCGGGIVFGISNLGINYSPFARLYFVNPTTQEENIAFHEEAVFTLNMDLNGGHVNVLGRYHYHSSPVDYIANELDVDGTEHSPLLGYAADGFPIYYRYLYSNANDEASMVSNFKSSYQLKEGNREGDGITAPNGSYDGTYYEDYEYIESLSSLDECGGRFGKTPEYPNGIYHYVLTDNWPFIPRCFKGNIVDNSFRIGPNCPISTAGDDCNTEPMVSVESIGNSIDFVLSPNPASNTLFLKIDEQVSNSVTQLSIYNQKAQTVFQSNQFEKAINIESLSPGVYYLQLEVGKEQFTKKLIIQ